MIHVALLRAVNLGGHNKLPMKDLAAIFTAAGAKDVRTFINSGNVLFAASSASVSAIGKRARAAIEKRFDFEAPIVFRSAAELAKVVRANPFAGEEHVHVTFFEGRPKKSGLELLESRRHASESLVARGRELYLHLPNGVGRTKLIAAAVDDALATIGTTRNFRTVKKLADLAKRALTRDR